MPAAASAGSLAAPGAGAVVPLGASAPGELSAAAGTGATGGAPATVDEKQIKELGIDRLSVQERISLFSAPSSKLRASDPSVLSPYAPLLLN